MSSANGVCRTLLGAAVWLAGAVALAAGPAPPAELHVVDHPNDAGTALDLRWQLSPDDQPDVTPRKVLRYDILRQAAAPGAPVPANGPAFQVIGEATYGAAKFTDPNCVRGTAYWYQVVAVAPGGGRSLAAASTAPAVPVMQLFDATRLWFGLLLGVVCLLILACIARARSGRPMRMRRIAGLEAVDEAVGRATEMGRTCLFVPGVQDINDMMTVAGLTVLARVAQTAAEYDSRVEVPTSRSLVMTAARETMQAAYAAAGRPEAYREDSVYYLTDEQFGYAAGVTGQMVRERPAACFYFGAFYAESLYLAETGNLIGAIQIAGTAESSQLPFFVAACDYTLIGEEFFAASAYLSGEPQQLGTLLGQDLGKLLGAALIVAGSVLATLGQLGPDGGSAAAGLRYLMNSILGSG